MGSRWFRRIFVFLVLFVITWILKIQMHSGPEEIAGSMGADKLYRVFQENKEMAMEQYAGKKIEIIGYVEEVIGDQYARTVYLTDYYSSSGNKKLIECSLTGRRFTRRQLEDSYEIALQGRVCKDQDTDWIKMDKCEIILY